MAKLTRLYHKIFGINANFSSQMGKFGSLKNGSPSYAANAAEVQSLGNFESGLYDCVIGNNSPAIQDLNGLFHHMGRQIGYIFQSGVSEYDADTTYYINSYCSEGGVLYISIADDNQNNLPSTSPTKWKPYVDVYLSALGVSVTPANDGVINLGSVAKSFKGIYSDIQVSNNIEIAALEIDWSIATNFYKSITEDSVFTFANAVDGQQINVFLIGDATQRTITFPTAVWSEDVTPNTLLANKHNAYTFIKINGTIYASVINKMA